MSLTALALDNADQDCQSLADIVNGSSTAPDVVTRLGQTVKPVAKVIEEIAASISGTAGYEPPVVYANGLNIIRATQTVTSGGNTYAPAAGTIPFVTGAVFDPAQWRLIIAKTLISRPELKALGVVAGGTVLLLVDGYNTAPFQFIAANIKTLCDADLLEGAFIKPTGGDGTAGAWVRIEAFERWCLNVRWFGALLDNATPDGAAVSAACALSYAMRRLPTYAGIDYGNGGGPSVYIPGWAYMNATTLVFNHTFRFYGDSWGGPAAQPCGLRWTDGVTGVENPGRAMIEGLAFIGGFVAAEGEHHGIHATQPFPYRNLQFGFWGGDGMNLDDAGGGNVNGVVGENVWASNCRNALWIKSGGDNNAMAHKNWNVDNCREWGIKEETFLGNSHYGHQVSQCGVSPANDGVSIGASVVSSGGNRYFAIKGQEVWCSTHAPSGTTDDNQGWAYSGAGGAGTGIPAWFNGILVRAGGSYYNSCINLGSEYFGCYGEGGQGQAQISAPSSIYGAALANGGVWKGSATFRPAALVYAQGAQLYSRFGFAGSGYRGADESVTVQVTEDDPNDKTVWMVTGSVSFPNSARLKIDAGDLRCDYANGANWYFMTGPNTTTVGRFGRIALLPFATCFSNLMIGADSGQARLHTSGAAAPAAGTFAQGDICWNWNCAVGQPKGWMCTVAGTPGTWVSMGNL